MDRPPNILLPFFAYGIFKPGQVAYFQLRELVSEVTEPARIAGEMLLRDGLPIIDPEGHGIVKGALLTFIPDRIGEAYDRISRMEPDNHYRWQEIESRKTSVNVLVGRSPRKGSEPCTGAEWDGWNDPLFTAALDVVDETLDKDRGFEEDLKPLFKLQMAYLLLWSSIERYVSLRYHLGKKVVQKVEQLAGEAAFAEGLRRHVKHVRAVYCADRPEDKEVLNAESPKGSVNYYYQVRSNITHRGKGVFRDYERLKESLEELVPIFREVLKAAKNDARLSVGE